VGATSCAIQLEPYRPGVSLPSSLGNLRLRAAESPESSYHRPQRVQVRRKGTPSMPAFHPRSFAWNRGFITRWARLCRSSGPPIMLGKSQPLAGLTLSRRRRSGRMIGTAPGSSSPSSVSVSLTIALQAERRIMLRIQPAVDIVWDEQRPGKWAETVAYFGSLLSFASEITLQEPLYYAGDFTEKKTFRRWAS
jgi:hypothetical protein